MAKQQWYYGDGGEQRGPFDEGEISGMVLEGKLKPDTLVWRSGLDNWVKLEESELAPLLSSESEDYVLPLEKSPPPSGKACFHCERLFSPDELVEIDGVDICAECKPAFLRKMQESGKKGQVYHRYGGFWIRALALIIDGFITFFLGLPIGFVMGLVIGLLTAVGEEGGPGVFVMIIALQILNFVVGLLIPLLYDVWFLTRKNATPGKMLLGLKVINADGTEKITAGKAVGRYFAKVLNGFTLNIGYIIAAFDDEKRGLHDMLCSTRVVYK
ncbi:MAG: RDD family protein [Victivallales bacterium]|nr:RDD family protein [Victivallales bacterium]